jgi:uncharacterized membrane protein
LDHFLKLGRVSFAIPIVAFGVLYLLYGRFAAGVPPVPPWTPGGSVGAYVVGVLLLALGISIAANFRVRLAASVVGILFLLCVLFLHAQKLPAILRDPNVRTGAFESLAMAGAALVLAKTAPLERPAIPGGDATVAVLGQVGLYLFTFSMVIFGVQHFLYASFIAALIPSWIPGPLFFAYFTGVGFIAAALSITFKIWGRLGALLLAVMFFLWVVLLHAPRVATHLHNKEEWTSLFVALAMAGGSLVIAETLSRKAIAPH